MFSKVFLKIVCLCIPVIIAISCFSVLVESGDPKTDTWKHMILENGSGEWQNGAHNLFPADVDGDGVCELIGNTYIADTIQIYDYDGTGGMNSSSNWDRYGIDSSCGDGQDPDTWGNAGAHFNCPVDIDLDGDIDIIVANNEYIPDVLWYENPGNSTALSGTPFDNGNENAWHKHTLYNWDSNGERGCYAYEIASADIDGDGDYDCAIATKEGGDIYIVRNPRVENGTQESAWTERVFLYHNTSYLSTQDGWMGSVYFGDVNNDGQLEVLGARRNLESLYFSYSGGCWDSGNWTTHTLDSSDGSACEFMDIDGDGYDDVFSNNDDNGGHLIYRNPAWVNGSYPENWDSYLIDNTGSRRQCDLGDIDGDGDNDIVVAHQDTDDTVWYENDGTPWGASWSSYVIDDTGAEQDYSHFVHLHDVDSDGDLDVLHTTCRSGASYFSIYFNPLDPPPVEEINISFQSINNQVNDTVLQDQNRTFNWTKVNDTVYYQLQISNSSTFGTTFVSLADINETNYGANYAVVGDYIEFILPYQYNVSWYGYHYYQVRAYTT